MEKISDKIFGDIAPRNTNKVVFPSIGKCIYCGFSEGRLTDEHIIPFSMGGIQIMEKASCDSCSEITSKFELIFSREIFGDFRTKHKLPSRRKKKRPDKKLVRMVNGDEIEVPFSEFPAPTYMLKCTEAGILNDISPNADMSFLWQIIMLTDNKNLDDFTTKYGTEVTYRFRHSPQQFAQTLAKIAHSYVMAYWGKFEFEKLALDLILGRSNNLSYVVGGSLEISPSIPGAGHLLDISVSTDFGMNVLLIIVNIRLFASSDTPNYHVVVGRVRDKNIIQEIIKICKDGGSELNPILAV